MQRWLILPRCWFTLILHDRRSAWLAVERARTKARSRGPCVFSAAFLRHFAAVRQVGLSKCPIRRAASLWRDGGFSSAVKLAAPLISRPPAVILLASGQPSPERATALKGLKMKSPIPGLAVLTLIFGVAGQAKGGLIINGGFETGDFTVRHGWNCVGL